MNLEDLKIKDILPGSISGDANVSAAAAGIDPNLQAVTNSVDELFLFSNIDNLPMSVIEHLAWMFHISSKSEGWGVASTDADKRNLVKNAIILHKMKGTRHAIEYVLNILGLSGEIQEWFEYAGAPYTFRVKVKSGAEVTTEKIINLRALINEYKNKRSELEDLSLTSYVQGQTPKVAIGMKAIIKVSLFPVVSNADITVSMSDFDMITEQVIETLCV